MPLDELAIIDRFFRPLAGEGALGLLDDAGILKVAAGHEIVVTADMIAAGIHFLADDPADTIARKALRVNLSDLAAKGAKPLAYTLSLGLSDAVDESWFSAFTAGLSADQSAYGVSLLGGDTISVASGPVISVCAFGAVPSGRAIHRFGGKVGDSLYVTGEIGAAALGLALLRQEDGPWRALPGKRQDDLVRRYRVPEPPTALAPVIQDFASAAMDISDGLVGDCDKLAAASGCSALIEADRVPLPAGLGQIDEALLARLLTAGDDYQFLVAVPAAKEKAFEKAGVATGVSVTRIGELRSAGGPTEVLASGRPLQLYRRAYMHRAGTATQ